MQRRSFISKTGAAVAASTTLPLFAIGKPGKSANGKVNVAFIGSGGWIARQPYNQGCKDENLVAFCDVDRELCAENMKNWKTEDSPFFDDFRVMLDKMHKDIDAVVVSTPDHTHAAASVMAMKMGKHCYCEKPLTWCVEEARVVRKTAAYHNVATQMGNQGTASAGLRSGVQVLQAGIIGKVREIHVWSDRPWNGWAQGENRPQEKVPVPAGLEVRPEINPAYFARWERRQHSWLSRPYLAAMRRRFEARVRRFGYSLDRLEPVEPTDPTGA